MSFAKFPSLFKVALVKSLPVEIWSLEMEKGKNIGQAT